MAEPRTMRDVKSLGRLPPRLGLRSEISRIVQLQRLGGERARLHRELEVSRQRQQSVESRLHDLEAQIADLETRAISQPIRTGIGPPPSADTHLTVEY